MTQRLRGAWAPRSGLKQRAWGRSGRLGALVGGGEGGQEGGDVLGGHGLGEQEALGLVAAAFGQEGELLGRLPPLRPRCCTPSPAPSAITALTMARSASFCTKARSIFSRSMGNCLQVGQAGVAGAEVVQARSAPRPGAGGAPRRPPPPRPSPCRRSRSPRRPGVLRRHVPALQPLEQVLRPGGRCGTGRPRR